MTDFNFDISDDLEVTPDYPEVETGPRPPLPGNYLLKPTQWDFRKNKAGELVLWKNSNGDPTYPLITIAMAEISDPIDYARKVGLFQDVATLPFQREEGKLASQAADLLRSLDSNVQAVNTGDVIRELTKLLNGQMEFRGRIDYAGYDKTYADAQLVEFGPDINLPANKKAKNDIYKRAKIQGYKRIKAANTQANQASLPLWKWVGPSGNVIECRPTITVFYPADDTVTLGPDKAVL